jgi:HK97 family phage major capsid protein
MAEEYTEHKRYVADNETAQFRMAYWDKRSIDEEKRTVELSFASEETLVPRSDPYEGRYYEKLGLREGEMDLEFIGSGRAPLLLDHDRSQMIGKVISVGVSGGRARALVKVSRSAMGNEVWNDIIDGIRENVSVGYYVKSFVEEGREDDVPILRANDWYPFEISMVSVPADMSVGVGRSEVQPEEVKTETEIEEKQEIAENLHERSIEMADENKVNEIDVDAVKREAAKEEKARVREISKLGAKHDMADKAEEAIENGESIDAFRKFVLDNMQFKSDRSNPQPQVREQADLGLTDKEAQRFSIVKAIRLAANPNDARIRKEASFEEAVTHEAAEYLKQATGRSAKGIVIPTDILKRDLTAGGTGTGAELVGTDHLGGSFIDALRRRTVVMGLGTQMLTNLQGDVSIPKQTGVSTASFIDPENSASSNQDTAFTTGEVNLVPRTLGANIGFSRQLMMQSDPSVEALVQNDLARQIAIAIDNAAFYGTNANGQPQGIIQVAEALTDYSQNGSPTYQNVIDLEAAVRADDVEGTGVYVTNATVRGRLKGQSVDTGSGIFVCSPDDMVNGHSLVVTNHIPTTLNDLFYGVFEHLVIGMWGGLDLIVDPYTGATSGAVRITALQSIDIKQRHSEAFSYIRESDGT